MSKNMVHNVVDGVVEDYADTTTTEKRVYCTDAKWVDVIMDELSDHELYNGTPTTDGLRRVAEKLFGSILVSKTRIINQNASTVTAEHELHIRRHDTQDVICVTACVDVRADKLPAPFNAHLVSTACTRAEGKALRRALKIRVQTAEELNNVDDEVSANEKINDQQIAAIKTLCRRNDVDLAALAKSISTANNIKEVTNVEGRVIISKLSSFQRTEVPEEFRGYKESWENDFGGK